MSEERLVVVFSDIEMGAGGLLDDFPHDDWLAGVLQRYSAPPWDTLPVDVVFNGDTFDTFKTAVGGVHPRLVTEQLALTRFARVADAHPGFFEGLRRFLERGRAPRAAHFVVGNHDQELLFPAVQRALEQRVGLPLSFPGLELELGELHLEHGSQGDPSFAIDPAQPFVEHDGQTLLALPWGSVAIAEVLLPLQPLLFDIDRLKPRKRVFELLPEVKDLVVGAFWRYWTRDWLRDALFGNDPVRRVNWTLVREVAWRFGTRDPDVEGSGFYEQRLLASDRHRVSVVGHMHRPEWRTWAERKLLMTGCLRDEFMLHPDGRVGRHTLPKTWAEVRMRGDRVVSSQLVEERGPPPPPGQAPEHISEVLPRVLPLLASLEQRAREGEAQQAQEHHERQGRS